MVRSIVLVGGQEAPLTKEAIAMKYTRQLKEKGSLVKYNSLVEGYSSESNLSTFDFTTTANLSIDYSPRENLSCDYSNSEDGDLAKSPLLAVIEEFILGQRKNTSATGTSFVWDTDNNDEDTDNSAFSCDSETEFSFSQSGVNHTKKLGSESAKADETAVTNQSLVPDTDNSPSNASRQRLKRWREMLQQKLRKASRNNCIVKDEGPTLKIQSMVPISRTAALNDEPNNTELGMLSSGSMDESTIMMLSRNSTLSTFQQRRGPINSCLPFDAILRCGPHSSQLRKQAFDANNCEHSEFSSVAVKIVKGTARSGMVKPKQSAQQYQSVAPTCSVPLTRAISLESIEETEIVFCESDDFSVGNDETLWDNPRLWERWAPTETPVIKETLNDASPPTRRARSLQNPTVEKMPYCEFYKSRTSDQKTGSQPKKNVLSAEDMKASFSLLRDEGVEIVQSDVLKEKEKLVAKSMRPKSPIERKISPLLAHLRSPRYAGLPRLAQRTTSKASEESPSNQNIPTVEHKENHRVKRQSPILCFHCRHELDTIGHTRQIGATECLIDKLDGPALHTATSASLSIIPISQVTPSIEKDGGQQSGSIVILDEAMPSIKAENLDMIASSQSPGKTSALETSYLRTILPRKNVSFTPTATSLARPPVRLSVETYQQMQSALECTTCSVKPWNASAKFQEVAPKIDFCDDADEIELVREAPVRLHSRVFWHTRRFRSSTPKNENLTKNRDNVLKTSDSNMAVHSGGELFTDATHITREETIQHRALLPLNRFKSLLSLCQSSTENNEHEMRVPKSESIGVSFRRLVARKKRPNRTHTHFPSPISIIAPVAQHSPAEYHLEKSETTEVDNVVPNSTLNGGLPGPAKQENSCQEIEPCQTYDEALALEQAKKQVHIENCRFALTDQRNSSEVNPEELRGDKSFDAKKEATSTCIPASYPFKATYNKNLQASVSSQTAGSVEPAILKGKNGESPPKQKSMLDIFPDLVEKQSNSDSSSSSLKKVLRRVAKHRVAFKEEIDVSVHTGNSFTNRLVPEDDKEDITLEMNASDIVLLQLAIPNVEERKSETKTVPPRRPQPFKRKTNMKAKHSASIEDENNAPQQNIQEDDTQPKTESKVIFEKCVIVRELALSPTPSESTQTCERFAVSTKKVRPKKKHHVVDPNDVEAVMRRSDETVATGGTKTSVVSGISRLTAAERKLARRLASDINILAKIEKKRRAMGQPGSKTKTEGIEKSLKLLQSINASRHERKTKEGSEENEERDDKETAKEGTGFGNFFGTFAAFGV